MEQSEDRSNKNCKCTRMCCGDTAEDILPHSSYMQRGKMSQGGGQVQQCDPADVKEVQ